MRLLRERLSTPGAVDDRREIASWVRDLARALDHAHENGVIHRDVKPGNVVFDSEGRPMLLDFGLARDIGDEESGLTMSSDPVGTRNYMAPEQIERAAGEIGPHTDVYALGVTLFECLIGRTPFGSDSHLRTMERILAGDVVTRREERSAVPTDLWTICMKSIERDPGRRYASAGAFAADLDAFLEYRPIQASRTGVARRATRFLRRHRLVSVVAGAALVVLAVSWWYWTAWRPARIVDAALTVVTERLAERRVRVATAVAAEFERDALAARPPKEVVATRVAESERAVLAAVASIREIDREIERKLDDCVVRDPENAATKSAYADFAAQKLREELDAVRGWLRTGAASRWHRLLAQVDVDGRYRELLDVRGLLEISCERGAAELWLCPRVSDSSSTAVEYAHANEAEAVRLGCTPLTARPTEGCYVLRARLPGTRISISLSWFAGEPCKGNANDASRSRCVPRRRSVTGFATFTPATRSSDRSPKIARRSGSTRLGSMAMRSRSTS